jgi:hypothetical protein
MAEVNGQLVTCDRCGATVFRRCVGAGEADGGFTRWDKFEPLPPGWELVAVPNGEGTAHLRVCPSCSALWRELLTKQFLDT